MTIYHIDEFVICEYAAWDGDFTPPTSEWSPDARQLSPTNGVIELPLYIRPGIGDGSNGRGSGITIPSPENAVINLNIYIQRNIIAIVSSPENAVLKLEADLLCGLDIVIPSPENAVLQLRNYLFSYAKPVIPSPENAVINLNIYIQRDIGITISSPENAVLKLEADLLCDLDIVIPSPENAVLQLSSYINPDLDITIPSPENATLLLGNQAGCDLDILLPSSEDLEVYLQGDSTQNANIVLPSPENAVLQLSSYINPDLDITIPSPENANFSLSLSSLIYSDLDDSMIGLLPHGSLKLIQNEIKLPIIFNSELEEFIDLTVSFNINPEVSINIILANIVLPSPENAVLQLSSYINPDLDITIPSPENANFSLSLSSLIYSDLDDSMIGLLPHGSLKLIQNEIKLPIIYSDLVEEFIDLTVSFNINPEVSINIILVASRIYTFSFVNALELEIQFDFLNTLNSDFEKSFSFKNSLTSEVTLSYSFLNRILAANELEKNFTFFNRILTDDPVIPNPEEYNGFYFSEIHGA